MRTQFVKEMSVELVERSFTEAELEHNVDGFTLRLRLLRRQMK